jgi:branched-chain amino acid transport system permease protein
MSVARPTGVFNRSYAQELIIVRTNTQWVFVLGALLILFTLPFYSSGYVLSIANQIGITLISVLGLHILMGYCGQVSIGQSAFMGVGAYVAAILVKVAHLSFWLALPIATIASGLVGIIVGLPSLRVKGFYLVMATLAAQEIIPWLIGHFWTELTGGVVGISVPAINLAGNSLLSQADIFFVIWPLAIFGLYYSVNLGRTKIGRAFIAIRDNDLAAELMGINLFKYKLLAFFICSLYAGAAGALWAEWTRSLAPQQFTLSSSILYMGMLVVGGLGSNAGACMGVVFLTIVDEIAKTVAQPLGLALGMQPGTMAPALAPGAFGLCIMLFLIFVPRGLADLWTKFKAYYRLTPFSY